jgi:PAS domain S-box-containing protein
MTSATPKPVAGNKAPSPAAFDVKLASLWVTFRNIHVVVFLILIFAVIQMVMLLQVCDSGMKTADSLEHQGLPYLNQLGGLQEHLALFRLYSYEYLFTQDSERASKEKAVETVVNETREELQKTRELLPNAQGRLLASNLEAAFDDLNLEFIAVRRLVDSDFPGAMKKLDQEVPPRIQKTTDAASALENYGFNLSGRQANATFGSFGWIKKNAVLFGSANIVIALGAVIFILLATRRTRAQLSDTMSRLEERTGELTSSLSLLNATLDSTADGIVAIDKEDKVLCFNQKFLELWGFSNEMLQRRRASELITLCSIQTTDPERFLKQIENCRASSQSESLDVIEFKEGRTVEYFARPQQGNQQHGGIVLSFRDITKRKQAEAELNYERNLLRALMDNADDRIYFKDSRSRFITGSASMARLFGLQNAAELTGKKDGDFFSDEHTQEAFEDEQKIMHTGEPMIGKVEKETWQDGHVTWALSNKMPFRSVQGEIIGTLGISKDITAIKAAEARLDEMHRQLLEASRKAGMSEVATSVLHNVGNVLNSVNVSSTLIADKLGRLKVENIGRGMALIRAHAGDLDDYFTNDPKGRQLPDYLANLAAHLEQERGEIVREVGSLVSNILHIKEIVAMQQSYAKTSGVLETLKIADLVEDAMRMNNGSISRHKVKVVRDFAEVPPVLTEKHKVLQILVNLIRNAKHACDDSGRDDKQINLRVANGDGRVKISVGDNGIGIPPENLTRIFGHGFTTRKEGHGFGLHSGALAAKDLGGTLVAFSDGPGRGATFTLEIPTKHQRENS